MSTDIAFPSSAPNSAGDLRPLHGRYMNSSSNVYKLPADNTEMDRLTMQHRIWVMLQGGLYPPETEDIVQTLLSPTKEGSPRPQIVDVGSGSGIWAIEMALKFPHVDVLGIDLAESKPAYAPPNCRFIVRDVMNGLGEFENTFSLVHCRAVGGHVSNVIKLVDVIGQILKPGGIFFFFDGNFPGYNINRVPFQPMPLSPPSSPASSISLLSPTSQTSTTSIVPPLSPTLTYSWFTRWFSEVSSRMACHGQEHVGGDHVEWQIRNNARFDQCTVKTKTYWSPVGWKGEEKDGEWAGMGAEIGRMMGLNIFAFLDASVPVLLASNVPHEDVNFWLENTKLEVLDESVKQYLKWDIAWAIKAGTTGSTPILLEVGKGNED